MIRVNDILGRTSMIADRSEIEGGLDISRLNNGIYFISVEHQGALLKVVKFVVER
jgi:hypothetical protein